MRGHICYHVKLSHQIQHMVYSCLDFQRFYDPDWNLQTGDTGTDA
jgi:hypothetical protein